MTQTWITNVINDTGFFGKILKDDSLGLNCKLYFPAFFSVTACAISWSSIKPGSIERSSGSHSTHWDADKLRGTTCQGGGGSLERAESLETMETVRWICGWWKEKRKFGHCFHNNRMCKREENCFQCPKSLNTQPLGHKIITFSN